MQTNLADFIRDTPAGREAEAILRKCVHCGFCTATCPTYQLLGDELDGPRGRIYLMKQVLEGAGVTAKTQRHLDRCLTCRSCETTCPSGVEYGRLVDIGRAVVAERVRRPAGQRLLRLALREFLPRGWLFGPAYRLGQLFRPLLPAALKAKVPARQKSVPAIRRDRGRHGRRMLMLAGCVQPSMSPNINTATARVLDRLGIALIEADRAGCCGAVRMHLDDHAGARSDARRNIDAWWPHIEAGAEAIVMTASGCGAYVREYAHLLEDDPAYAVKAARVTLLARDVAEVLAAEKEGLMRLLEKNSLSPGIGGEGGGEGAGGRGGGGGGPPPPPPRPSPSPRPSPRKRGEGEEAHRLPRALQPAARPADPRRGGGHPAGGRLRTDAGGRRPPVLRLGRHLLDPAARNFAEAARQQAGMSFGRRADGHRQRQHRLHRPPAGRHAHARFPLDRIARPPTGKLRWN